MRYLFLLPLICLLLVSNKAVGQDRWKAPAEADTLKNPYSLDDAGAIVEGEDLYTMFCSSCHGMRGDGEGEAGQTWNPPPADFTSEEVQRQSDGALFWKAMEGNPPGMLSYEQILSEQEVWQIVTYLRGFGPD